MKHSHIARRILIEAQIAAVDALAQNVRDDGPFDVHGERHTPAQFRETVRQAASFVQHRVFNEERDGILEHGTLLPASIRKLLGEA